MASKALILVDLENEWLDKKSDYFVGDISKMLKRTNRLIDRCRARKYKIIFITHIEKGSDSAFAPDSPDVEIIGGLHRNKADVLIKKNKISPFYKTNLSNELKGVKEIVVSGILSNLCVRSTVQDAYDRDFKITVIKDCCASFDKKTQDFTFADLKFTRPEVEFKNLKDF
jgi:nicotinamidase-related amidase